MNVKMISMSSNGIETVFRAFRVCYSAATPTTIKIPMMETGMGDFPDIEEMSAFIKDKLDKGHFSPLEHMSFTFAVEGVSRALSHQLVRQRTFRFSQQSQRYVNAENFEFVVPETIKNLKDKISFGIEDVPSVEFGNGEELFKNTLSSLMTIYKALIELGVSKEDARAILPNATTTNLVVTFDLRNFRNFYAERSCKHAQTEIRELAEEMMKQVKQYVPFADYKARKCGITCFECVEGK